MTIEWTGVMSHRQPPFQRKWEACKNLAVLMVTMKNRMFVGSGLLAPILLLASCVPAVRPPAGEATRQASCGTPPAAEVTDGQLTMKLSQCNVTEHGSYSSSPTVNKGQVIEYCMAFRNGQEKDSTGVTVKLLSQSAPFGPIDTYTDSRGKRFGTLIYLDGNYTYQPYQERVTLSTIKPKQSGFVCQSFTEP